MNIPSKNVAFVLALLLGWMGAHHFYLRNYGVAIIWLLVLIFIGWTGLALFMWIVAIFQGIAYLFWDDATWARRFKDAV